MPERRTTTRRPASATLIARQMLIMRNVAHEWRALADLSALSPLAVSAAGRS